MSAKISSLLLLVAILVSFSYPTAKAQEALAADCLQTPNSNGCHAGLPIAEYTLLLDQMTLHPKPDVDQLPFNEEEVYKFAFRSLNKEGATIYNAPNGQAVGTMPLGAKYATTMGYQSGWVMVQPDEWVRESDTTIVQPSTFSGVKLNENSLRFPLAWVLLPEYPAPYPGAEGDHSRPRWERYTLVNIFAEAEAGGLKWYLVAPDTWIIQTSIGRVNIVARPEGVKGNWVAGDLYEQVFVAYENDTPVFATLMSSGRPQYPTHEGLFQTWGRFKADAMNGAEGRDDFYNVDFVPWVLYYDESFAVHAVYWHDKFGYRASRGCLGLSLTDARWVFEWTEESGYELPWVYIFSSGTYQGES